MAALRRKSDVISRETPMICEHEQMRKFKTSHTGFFCFVHAEVTPLLFGHVGLQRSLSHTVSASDVSTNSGYSTAYGAMRETERDDTVYSIEMAALMTSHQQGSQPSFDSDEHMGVLTETNRK